MKNLFLALLTFLTFTSFLGAQPDTLTILHVNDSHSTLEAIGPRDNNLNGSLGAISRVATLVGLTKMTEPNVLFLHAGDISIGDVFFNKYFHVPELQILDAIGVDAMTLGNHEFDLGPEALLGSLIYTFPTPTDAFPLLTSNVDFSNPAISDLQNYIESYTIKSFGDLKIGIFGLTTPATNVFSNPYPAVVSEDIVTIAATMVTTLRTVENCDIVVLLSHLGISLDQVVANYVSGINVIVGGHDHYKFEQPMAVTDPLGGTTWIVQAGSNYLNVGKMILLVEGSNVQLLNYQLIPINESIPQETTIQANVDFMKTEIELFYGIPFFSQAIGYASSFFEEEAKDLLEIGAHDTPMGNLVADAFRSLTSTDIALQAGGSMALPLWEGSFTPGDLFRVNGYGFNMVNTLGFQIATFDLTGMNILTGLTFGLSDIENNDEFLIQVSGMEYTYDGTKPPEERLVSVLINGEPLDPMATYSVTANEGVLLVLDVLEIEPTNVNILNGVTEFQALSQYVMDQNNFIQPKTLGRILNVGDMQARTTVIAAGIMNPQPNANVLNKMFFNKILFEIHMIDLGFMFQPQGQINIRYPKENLVFKSDVCNWLLVNNHTATLTGTGQINDDGNYGFLIIANDNPDQLRIAIWDKNDGDNIVYDNLNPQNIFGSILIFSRQALAKELVNESVVKVYSYSLEQNYPNPFNPTTTIRYQIPENGMVTLKIYDILGSEIVTLVNQEQIAGHYEVIFDASQLSSGVYLYTIKSGDFIQTKKMLLMK